MPKFTPITTAAGRASIDVINANFAALQTVIDTLVSRDGAAPNTMTAALDLNSQRIINLADGVNSTDAATVSQITTIPAADLAIATAAAAAAAASEIAAASSAANAATSEIAAAADAIATGNDVIATASNVSAATAAAILAQSYTTVGFGGTILDLGSVADPIALYPTDLGVL